MTWGLPQEGPVRFAWMAVACAGALAIAAPWLNGWRVAVTDAPARDVILVTAAADHGVGTLRAAILAADRSEGHARILVRVRRITLEAPLPPLVNPYGIFLQAHKDGTEIDASGIGGAVVDLAGPHMTITGFRIVKARAAVVVRDAHATLQQLTIDDSDTGVLVGEKATATRIEGSRFRRNRIAVQTTGRGGVVVSSSRFEDHALAAVWAVAQETRPDDAEIAVLGSHFSNDAGGLVIVDRPSRIEGNVFEGLRETAILISSARADVHGNKIRAGRGFGVLLDRLPSGMVYRNEIAHNCSGGIMLRSARNTQVISNELYQNGFGIVVMEGAAASPNTVVNNLIADHAADGLLLIGSSPMVRRNRLLQNAHSGLRLASLVLANGEDKGAHPLLDGNVLLGNGRDEPYRDQYVGAAGGPVPEGTATDCAWRLSVRASPAMAGSQ